MKIKFNREALQEALGLVGVVVPSRTPKPILECVRISTEVDAVTISATDLEVGINIQLLQVEIEEPGDVVLPADKLLSIIRESSDDVIQFNTDDSAIKISGADSNFTIFGHDVSQFPSVPAGGGDADFEIDLAKLQTGIELSIFAAAKESTRYALNGVLWEVGDKIINMVATDGRRLAKSIVHLDTCIAEKIPDGRIIVPVKSMSLLDRLNAAEDTKAEIKLVDNQIIITCGQVVISSNLVDGNFPKYEDIIPADYENRITLPTEATLSAVRRAALLATEDSKGIKLALTATDLIFSGRAPETGDATVDMKIDYKGQPMEVAFNPTFLIDVLRVIKADEFVLELGDANRPGVIKSGNDFIYIVMPVNL